MKFIYLLISLLLATSCSNEIADKTDAGKNVIRIGKIDTRAGNATSEWGWRDNDRLTVQVNGKTAYYTYANNNKWECQSSDFTKEAIGVVDANGIMIMFGEASIQTDQTTESKYRNADFMTGSGSLDFLTISGTLEHLYADLVIEITEGNGWSPGQFTTTMADATGLTVHANGSTTVSTYHSGATFRAIIPTQYVPKGSNIKMGTLAFGSGTGTPASLRGKSAGITYTCNYSETELKGKRLSLSLKLDVAGTVTINGTTLADFISENVNGVL